MTLLESVRIKLSKYKIIYLDGLRNYDVGKMQLENAGEPSNSFDAVSKCFTNNQ